LIPFSLKPFANGIVAVSERIVCQNFVLLKGSGKNISCSPLRAGTLSKGFREGSKKEHYFKLYGGSSLL
jgi:hypothetical protein